MGSFLFDEGGPFRIVRFDHRYKDRITERRAFPEGREPLNVASYLDDNSDLTRYGGTSFHAQSHGESFMVLVANRFEGNGLYILDEPETALSPQRQLSLIVEMDRLVKENSQFIIITHSPVLMAFPEPVFLRI